MNKKLLFLSFALVFSSLTVSAEEDTLATRHPEYLPALEIGADAPDFTAPDTLGHNISLSDYRGSYVIVDFWASWCGDCRKEIPFLKRLHSDVNNLLIDGKKLQWLSMSFDFKDTAWKNMLRKEHFSWPQISSLKSTKSDPTFKAYRLNWIPAFFIIDPQGRVVAKAITATGLRYAIMELAEKNRTHVFNLWEDIKAPTDNGVTGEEISGPEHSSNVINPTLTVYLPKKPNGLAVLACPGGGYVDVWGGTEGHNLAQWYNEQGITLAVLKYRLPNGHPEVPLDDVRRAMQILKQHQQEYGFKKLGIQGCSAGGHLAAMTSTHFTKPEERPDFQILFYPVITMDKTYTHEGSHDFLLGKNATKDMEDKYSNEKTVTADTPMAFIMANTDDNVVPVMNSVNYYKALLSNGVSASLHVYPVGGHGWCVHEWAYRQQWMSELSQWLSTLAESH